MEVTSNTMTRIASAPSEAPRRGLRLTVFTEYFSLGDGSTGKILRELAESMLDADAMLEITAISGDRAYRSALATDAEPTRARLRWTRLSVPRWDRTRTVLRMMADLSFAVRAGLRLFRGPKPDVALAVTNPFLLPWMVGIAARLRGVRFVYLVHDIYPDIAVAAHVLSAGSLLERVLRTLQGRALRSADRVVVLGRCARDIVLERYNVDVSRLRVIPNWPDVDVPSEEDAARARDAFRLEHEWDGFEVVYSGNLGSFHDFDTLLDAAPDMTRVAPSARLSFIGDGQARPRIEREIVERGLESVRCLPLLPHAEFPALLAAMDAAIVSLSPGATGLAVPLKAYNLLAAGVPIIAVMQASAEIARVVLEEGCGVHVSNGDTVGLNQAIRHLAQLGPDERCAMRQAGRRAAALRFPRSRAVQAYLDVLRERS